MTYQAKTIFKINTVLGHRQIHIILLSTLYRVRFKFQQNEFCISLKFGVLTIQRMKLAFRFS